MYKSLLTGQATTVKNSLLSKKYWPGVFLLAFLFVTNLKAEQIRIGIIDTGFCPTKLNYDKGKINIHPLFDATYSVSMNCDKLDKKQRRFHGHWVLETFLEKAPKDMIIEIWPVIIFDFQAVQKKPYWIAVQKKPYWINALKFLESKRIDVVLSAAGLPLTKEVPVDLKLIYSKFFVSSGRAGGPIKMDTKLFPHELAPQDSLYLIGSFYPPLNKDDYIYDDKLLYQDKIDYYFTQGPIGEDFVGTSRSVAIGLARAIELCPKEFHSQKNSELRSCLSKQKLILKMAYSGKLVPSL